MPQYELSFQDYWRIIRKRRWVIIFSCFTIFLSTVIYLNLQTPVYKAVATIKIEQRKTMASALMEYIVWSPGDPMATEAKIIESWLTADKVVRRLGLIKEGIAQEEINQIVTEIQESVSAERVKGTNLIQIRVLYNNPQKAAALANEVAKVYMEYDLERKTKQTRQVREFIENQLATVEAKLESSEEQLKKLKEQGVVMGIAIPLENNVAELKTKLSELLAKATERHPQVTRLREQINVLENQIKALPAEELDFVRLTRNVKVNEKLYITLRGRFEDAQIAEAEKTGGVSITEYATISKFPIKPRKKAGAMLGMMMGLMFGFILSFVVESLDTSIGTIDDVESLLKLPVLGVIPHVEFEERGVLSWWKRKFRKSESATLLDESKIRRIVHYQPKSSTTEAYRILRTNFKLVESGRKVFLVTSANPKEGKTTVLTNLALTVAQMGYKVLIVSSDLRRPFLYKTFGLEREPGLNEVLSQTIRWEKAVRTLSDILIGASDLDEVVKFPGLDNLNIITSGCLPFSPSELLGSKEMLNLIEEFKSKFDIVFFDSPPVLPVADALLLAPKVDGVLIVYEIGKTARSALLRAKNQLEASGAKVLGVVLNHIRPETEMYPGYYHYQYKYYGQEEKEKVRKGIDKKKIL